MSQIKVPTREQVNSESQAIFDQIEKSMGKVPNLYATIGYSSHALKAFLGFGEHLNKGVFTPVEREAISLAVSEVNQCDYCLAAHTMLAGLKNISKEETLNIRRGNVSDPKLNVIIRLAKSIAENKGKADADKLQKFLDAGFDNAAVMELIGLVIATSFTNYAYALTDVPIDFPLADRLN